MFAATKGLSVKNLTLKIARTLMMSMSLWSKPQQVTKISAALLPKFTTQNSIKLTHEGLKSLSGVPWVCLVTFTSNHVGPFTFKLSA